MTTTILVTDGGQILCPPFGVEHALVQPQPADPPTLEVTPVPTDVKNTAAVPSDEQPDDQSPTRAPDDEDHSSVPVAPTPASTSTSTSTVVHHGQTPTGDDEGLPLWVPVSMIIMLLAILAAVGVAVWALLTRTRPAPAMPSPIEERLIGPSLDDLVPDLITLADLAHGPAAEAQAVRVLRGVGLQEISVKPGSRFDDTVHHAASTRQTSDPALQGLVAEVVRSGWTNRHGVLRPADVVVWVLSGAPQEEE
jgi:hypothetical protein